jgi:nucleoside-diphosphate-sugar epimerase
VVYGGGSVKRDFLFVGDAVEATMRASAVNYKTIEAVNIVSGDSKTIREYVELLVKLVGSGAEIKFLLDKPAGQSLNFGNNRMFDVLGCWNLFPLEDGLRREINYFRELAKNESTRLKV